MNQVNLNKKIAYLAVLFAVFPLVGRSEAKQPGTVSGKPSNSRSDIAVQGCVARSSGYYVLIGTDPGNTHNLEEASRMVQVGSHLGEQVEVTGWESPQLSNSSSIFYGAAPGAVTVMVTSIKTIAGRCTD